MYNLPIIILLTIVFNSCTHHRMSTEKTILDYVDPLIGSGGHGHVFVGASVPNGMIQLGPNNLSKGWDWCSGYNDADSTIVGFAHTHLSGTGIADLGDILFMPIVGDEQYTPKDSSIYFSRFSKKDEKVNPGYYKVKLDTSDIEVELTASTRVGYHRYHYPDAVENKQVLIDLHEGVKSLEARKGALESYVEVLNDSTIVGYRYSDEWAKNHKVFFYSVFSSKIKSFKNYDSNKFIDSNILRGEDIKTVLLFGDEVDVLNVKTAISYVSIDGAKLNYEVEALGRDFEEILKESERLWFDKLSAIQVESKDEETLKKFYTSMYHAAISPSIFSDVNGQYRGADDQIHEEENYNTYSIFSFWDTYRAFHPLMTLIDTTVADYSNSIMNISNQQGRMPVWHLVGSETDCMTGVHSIPVLVDAVLKGLYDHPHDVLKEVSQFSDYNYAGLPFINKYNYIPADKEVWSVAKGLEYAVDDYAIAQLALKLNNQVLYEKHLARSIFYQNYFDNKSGFMRGKLANGDFRTPFDPSHSLHLEDDYVEGNAWQYTWLVPHDVEGLIDLFGGKSNFVNKLDSLFTVDSKLNEGASVDITGMIGQYAHGNEPSHHITYLYAFAGQPWKTADLIRKIDKEFYKTTADGLIGNEDCGQMSAWYIFTSIGFYPVNPNNGVFVFGSPLVDKASIRLNNGKTFKIEVVNNSKENKYIQSIELNNEKQNKFFITYNQIMKGGKLVINMGDTPNYDVESKRENYATSPQTLF
ncbi:GH92 family glycosyl hydrolase [Sphingobacterium bovistauri]|uniref:GH92 family glycosyl hydrolase n=1 Tax=Sphingobacterium bovistauri TaxID=2781959 RepID=A0ABS7Z631_9SPHI|nr:GH92 family glycosyl hydrolase [Sphingobacterium bovistauri]MCA5004389.1 GH92 family glycosyl hydrolase [Sphingobacterium bovistauri]